MSGGVGVVVFLYIVGTIITWVLCTAYIADQDSMYRRQYSDWIMYVLVGLCAGLFWPVVVIGGLIGLVANHLLLTYSSVRLSKRVDK